MSQRPIILVAPATERKGAEFADHSISLSICYTDALIASGGLPQIFPATTLRAVIAEAVQRCDGVLLTGGDDIDPKLYSPDLPEALAKTSGPHEPDRDLWEQALIQEVFAQRKPLLGICRGHQMLNVVLGGTLLVDIPTQMPKALNHLRMNQKTEPVHSVSVTADSLLARLTGQVCLAVNSTHHQAIGKLAPPLRSVAESADGIVEAVELREPERLPFCLGVQFHPERLVDSEGVFLGIFKGFVAACAGASQKKNL